MNDETWRIYGYTFINKANSKSVLSTKFTLLGSARANANPQSSLFKGMLLSFYVFHESFQVLSLNFQVCVNDMASPFIRTDLFCVQHYTGEVVSFSPWKLDTIKLFWNASSGKSFDNVSILQTFSRSRILLGKFHDFFRIQDSVRTLKVGKPPTNKSWLEAWLV